MQRKLHVATALDAKLGDDIERRGAQHLVFLVAQRLARRNNNRVAGVYANRVDVFHVTDRNRVALGVAHDLVLDFLPAGDTLLDQNFIHTRVHNAGRGDLTQLLPRVGDAAACAAERVRRTDDDRQADFPGKLDRVLHRVDDLGCDAWLADLFHRVLEHLAVLGLGNGLGLRAEELDTHLVKKAALAQLHGEVQASLAAEVGQQAVRALLLDDLLHRFDGQRLDIDLIGHGLIGHDGRGVGVYEHDLQTFLAQRAAGLRARVVKLGRLADDDRTGAQHHNLMNILAQRHYWAPPLDFAMLSINLSNRYDVSIGPGQTSGWYCTVNTGRPMCSTPSTVPSFRLT